MRPVKLVAVDWSGALSRAESKIWIAEKSVGAPGVRLECGRNRSETIAHLTSIVHKTPKTLIGVDFAFSFPLWFLDKHNFTTAIGTWQHVAEHGEDWLKTCPWPFWGRAGNLKPTTDAPTLYRTTENAAPGSPKSTFQLFYAGAVGTSALRGMPHLLDLQAAGCAIWPFEELSLPAVVEIYPRIYTGPINKGSSTARAAALEPRLKAGEITGDNLESATKSDDAFDALLSVLEMEKRIELDISTAAAGVAALPVALREGWIWSVPPSPAASNLRVDVLMPNHVTRARFVERDRLPDRS